MADLLTAIPFAVVSSVVTWIGSAWAYARKREAEHADAADRLEIHRDEFLLELLQNARAEITLVRSEIDGLREEQGTLRKLEQHVYHFQEALEHLERVLFPESDEDAVQAKRNAVAFLNRMRRLQDVKGTVLNEMQRLKSTRNVAENEGRSDE